MNQKFLRKISSVVLLFFIFQLSLPVFSQSQDLIKGLQDRYQSAYQVYCRAVAAGAPIDEIQAKLQTYFSTYDAYRKALNSASASQSINSNGGEAGSPTQSQPPAQASPLLAVDSSATTVSSVAASPQDKGSWVSKTFKKVREIVLGSADKRQMPLPEKILWSIGKALLPSLGVMMTAAFLAPFSPVMMIVGGIVVGASLGGLMTYAYEKRMNAKYRDTPKEDARIWRDVTVQGAVEAVMAPFNLATGGLFGMVGPTVGSAIGRVALTQAALSFGGAALSSGVGGVVKHLWATSYFHYPEKIASNEATIDAILYKHVNSGQPLSGAELKELDRLQVEIDGMKGEDYGKEDFAKDLKRAALSATISGFVGSVVSDRLYNYETGRWADRLSVRVFGSAAQGKQISNLFSTMPVNFVSGMAGATLEKSFINNDIISLRNQQRGYKTNSLGYDYYDRLIRQLEEKRDSIVTSQAGLDSMINNFSVRAAQLTVQGLKHNLVDAPRAKKAAVDEKYRENDPEWKKAAELYEKFQDRTKGIPDPRNFRSAVAFAKAQASYLKNLESARQDWLKQAVFAKQAESLPDRQIVKTEMTNQYERELKLNQILELGRLNGGMAHLQAMKTVLKEKNPDLAALNENEMTKLACQAVAKSYSDKYVATTAKVNSLEETIKKYDDYKAGRLALTDSEAKILIGQKSLISPSQYKSALVEQKVYELKNSNTRWDSIKARMPEILAESDRKTMEKYGGNWGTVITAEMYANGLAKNKYNPDGTVSFVDEFKKLVTRVPGMVESGVVNDYKTRVNDAIVGSVLPPGSANQNQFEKYMQTFAKSGISAGTGGVLDSIYGSSKDRIIGGFSGR